MPSAFSDELPVSTPIEHTDVDTSGLRYAGLLLLLTISAIVLAGRLGYLYLSDAKRFPITTIKVAASYHHVSHKELETVLTKHLDASFFSLPVTQLQNDLNAINWIDTADVERVWPDTLKIKLIEKRPIARWGNSLLTENGQIFQPGDAVFDLSLPQLQGPASQQLEVLQVYEKLSKILSMNNLNVVGLQLRENQSWILSLANDIKIYLGKKELEERVLRFCRAYPSVFAEKADELASVDLRYPRGMAVQWKQQTGR